MESKGNSTDGATPNKGKAARAVAEVGGVRSSNDAMPDLWWAGQNMEERRDVTCSAEAMSERGRGDGPQGLPAPDKVRRLQIVLYRKAKSKPDYRFWSLYQLPTKLARTTQTDKGTRKAGCGKTARPV